MISTQDRQQAVSLIDEAVASGARKQVACRELGLDIRTHQRWHGEGKLRSDGRADAVRPVPANKLSAEERAAVLQTVNEPRFADLPPTQIVPLLADEGRYRVELLSHPARGASAGASYSCASRGASCAAAALCQGAQSAVVLGYHVSAYEGAWHVLLPVLILDVYSRKIVAHEVHGEESAQHAVALIERAVLREGVGGQPLVIHQDNGSVMKASTFTAKLQQLGIDPSYNRPGVSDDNAYAESLFRTCKYRPDYPGVFASLEEARRWVLSFVRWYNHTHKHRNLKFVSPAQRHSRADQAIFAARTRLYEQARTRHPQRWSRGTRDWSLADEVWLNRPVQDGAVREAA